MKASYQSESNMERPIPRSDSEGFDFSSWKTLPFPTEQARRRERNYRIAGLERLAALGLLVAIGPLIATVALAVKAESPRGPVFYRQKRVGLDRRRRGSNSYQGPERRVTPADGQPFMIWKFRTMLPDAEAQTGPVWASEDDPRVTRVGRVLRDLRLDELPQLMNVLGGQMRLIGPRPERPHFVSQLSTSIPDYRRRLEVPPGITGLAQVEKHYDANVDDVRRKVGYDIFYVDNRCRLLDLKILIKTVGIVLRGRGAR
jgi:lipopolysaccharide/colanic/teichoic acid biosynthesis glycosyltransferase